ncbi:MAG: transporter [candidate division WOR-3 bacterium]|nr:transporter [candidate division WOR-3 bacterium]
MRKIISSIIVLKMFIGIIFATPLVWHSANVLNFKNFLFQANFSHTKTCCRFDATSNRWQVLPDDQRTLTLSPEFMLGYGILNKLEVKIAVPIAYKKKSISSTFGFGDLMLKTRYNLINKKLIAATIAGAVVVPISSRNANPQIDDHTFDAAIGWYLFIKEYKGFTTDFRFGYFYNGKTNSIKIGNMFEYFTKIDYKITPKFTPYLAFLGYIQNSNKNLTNNQLIPNSNRNRHNFQLGGVYKLNKELTMRARILVPLKTISQGGEVPSYSFGLDFWIIK